MCTYDYTNVLLPVDRFSIYDFLATFFGYTVHRNKQKLNCNINKLNIKTNYFCTVLNIRWAVVGGGGGDS